MNKGPDPRQEGRVAHPDAGVVTIEIAIGLSSILFVLALAMAVLGIGIAKAESCRYARDGAREAAIGADATGAVERNSGGKASITVTNDGPWVRVSVTIPTPLDGLIGGNAVTCEVSARKEEALP